MRDGDSRLEGRLAVDVILALCVLPVPYTVVIYMSTHI